jgi:hypothetical protein
MQTKIDRKLEVLSQILRTCSSQDLICLNIFVSVSLDAKNNNHLIDYYIDYYTKLWASYND